ncbi:putative selenium-dependent hydroxylase accessory protein YqeC [Clostridioides sp. ES-S-0108-01]|uniref:selenium cofactor biosynthesis protein YqeC n=1 Tax=unclassified Clostridioides TaxID=2635829 RepID=UPI001D0C6D36|nr:putative selenium-dependent hydroxylase accessory protein YqeC [Clostridioides sp. ES-S-0171-01]MCC0689115.1 putative selenium-dependent hydroxylase accessory protein YqeC [Clostridioides sp. ES-S-0056-01]MCC0714551.1 putative selenium-dependent hydroxylase accessory protein YqeC [Clostridioides sp. ES-S-0077-01]MCC0781943.1 putative selenium-dependent hydroxylase accessory protein YqeC [Clostridioides sp. ES-S-0108-01]UDN49757.1 putative selenium-dependent hydroxylase accessory protein YqeC
MELSNIIEKNEIITVVGAGGKTSFINYFADFYRDKLKVLLTTTTKIYVPSDYDNIIMTIDGTIIPSICHGITVCGSYINNENKVVGIDSYILDEIVDQFDLALIEGDGSKRKKLKGWNAKEPIVYHKTTKTIGILDITSFGMNINEENIHRVDIFKKIANLDTCSISSSTVSLENLKNIVLNPNGLFKNYSGKRVLFINKVENEKYKNLAIKLIKNIKKYESGIEIFYGSIKQKFCVRY